MVNEMSGACAAQMVRAIDCQSRDPGSNLGAVESVLSPQIDFKYYIIPNFFNFLYLRKILYVNNGGKTLITNTTFQIYCKIKRKFSL